MTKNDLINNVAETTKFSKATCEKILDAFVDEVTDCLIRGDKLVIKGFAVFESQKCPERRGRNPKTGEIDIFPSYKTAKCRLSQTIKDAVNGK